MLEVLLLEVLESRLQILIPGILKSIIFILRILLLEGLMPRKLGLEMLVLRVFVLELLLLLEIFILVVLVPGVLVALV